MERKEYIVFIEKWFRKGSYNRVSKVSLSVLAI